MNNTFKTVGKAELSRMSYEEQEAYFESYRDYYRQLPFDKERCESLERNYRIAAEVTRMAVKYGKMPVIIGRENIPNEPCIFASNHLTSMDQFYIVSGIDSNRPIHFLASSTLKALNRGAFFEKVGAIFVDLKSLKSVTEAMSYLTQLSVLGKDIFIFPQGTRDPESILDVDNINFNRGTVKMAQISGRPIVPISYTYHFKTGKIIIRFHKPIYVKANEDTKKANEVLRLTVIEGIHKNLSYFPEFDESDELAARDYADKLKSEREVINQRLEELDETYIPPLAQFVNAADNVFGKLKTIYDSLTEPSLEHKNKMEDLRYRLALRKKKMLDSDNY